uniref:RNA-directed DNA polymerase, eukaryota, reverse transcriptase zinc-binding domain protein n=1 Tax=Tanacetum cinerariifolium TaxID=118510 RepID=A0A699HNM8_TANCI|nr:RNA-directed DNA polymerase, eukaryota, reverse transcriptase zinc-binding domain protein [Tanacetum cinerariifolium]
MIKSVLDSIVDKNQSAFIPERQITDNILLTKELLKGAKWLIGSWLVFLLHPNLFVSMERDMGILEVGEDLVVFMDTAYGKRSIRRIGNCEYAFTCEELALICHISFPGYGVLVRND